jgi:hypothetical protein
MFKTVTLLKESLDKIKVSLDKSCDDDWSCDDGKNLDKTTETELICHTPL